MPKKKLKLSGYYIDGYKGKTTWIYHDDDGNFYEKNKDLSRKKIKTPKTIYMLPNTHKVKGI